MIGVIPAAGIGKRMYPLTVDMPKPLLPVLNKPIIEHVINCLKSSGIEEIIVIVRYKKEMIKRKLRDVKFVEQDVLDGTVSAIKLVEKYIDENFVVMWGDNFFKGNLKDLIISHIKNRADITVMLDREGKGAKAYIKNGKIFAVEERPKKSRGFAFAGVYTFSTEIFDHIDEMKKSETGEYEISNLLQLMINKGVNINYVWLKGWRMNVTTPSDLLQVNLKMLDNIGKPFYIGENCKINGDVTRSVIGDYVEINQSIIKNSLVMNYVKINKSVIGGMIIRENKIIENLNKFENGAIAIM